MERTSVVTYIKCPVGFVPNSFETSFAVNLTFGQFIADKTVLVRH